MHRGPLGECDVSLTCALEAPQLPASAHQATIRAHTGWQVLRNLALRGSSCYGTAPLRPRQSGLPSPTAPGTCQHSPRACARGRRRALPSSTLRPLKRNVFQWADWRPMCHEPRVEKFIFHLAHEQIEFISEVSFAWLSTCAARTRASWGPRRRATTCRAQHTKARPLRSAQLPCAPLRATSPGAQPPRATSRAACSQRGALTRRCYPPAQIHACRRGVPTSGARGGHRVRSEMEACIDRDRGRPASRGRFADARVRRCVRAGVFVCVCLCLCV